MLWETQDINVQQSDRWRVFPGMCWKRQVLTRSRITVKQAATGTRQVCNLKSHNTTQEKANYRCTFRVLWPIQHIFVQLTDFFPSVQIETLRGRVITNQMTWLKDMRVTLKHLNSLTRQWVQDKEGARQSLHALLMRKHEHHIGVARTRST